MVKDALVNGCSLILTAILLPVLLVQGLMVKIRTPILPGASGDPTGLIEGPGDPVELIVLGESTVAGVGVNTYDQALASQTARALGKVINRCVRWRAVGRTGMMARELHAGFLKETFSFRADIIMISLGVNDVLHMHSPGRYTRDLSVLIAEVRCMFGDTPIMLAGIAPVGCFPAIPQPLRYILGLRARMLDRAAAVLSHSLKKVYHCPGFTPADIIRASFASDGFHPNLFGYSLMGDLLGMFMADNIDDLAKSHISPPLEGGE